jgi:uncharacterized membrane protein YfcA
MNLGYSFLGLLVGILVGLTGMGGGSLMAPLLVLLMGVHPLTAVGTDLAYSTITRVTGAALHWRHHTVQWRICWRMALGSVPGTILGVLTIELLIKQDSAVVNAFVLRALGCTLLIVAAAMLLRSLFLKRAGEAEARATSPVGGMIRWLRASRPLLTVGIGAIVGFLVGITSVGSGSLIIVALALLYPRLTGRELVGTDLLHGAILTAAATLAHLGIGTINFATAGLLLLGSIPGVIIGTLGSTRIPDGALRPVIAITLGLVALRLI